MQWYRRAADQRYAIAQNNLGLMYDNGRGVPQDYAQAVLWYRKAADQGAAGAQYNLGLMYFKGQGVPQDYAQAVMWFRKAADQGAATAQLTLGLMYAEGWWGVPQDYAQAYRWFNLAAARLPPGVDHETAVQNRDRNAARLTPAQLADAQARARAWQPTPETPSARPPAVQLPLPVSAPPSVSTPFLRRDLIRKVQERLQAVGFSPGTIDGGLGAQTRSALRGFQQSEGLPATGDPDEQTLDALGVR